MAKSATVVGLNIGSNLIKAVEVRGGRGQFDVTGVAIMPTPPDTVSNGVIMQPDVLGQAIKQLLASNGIRAKSVVSSVAGQSSLVVRVIDVPKMSEAELAESMKWELERHIPFAATEVIEDHVVLPPLRDDPNAQNMEVLLAAAQEDMITAHVQTLQAAGLDPLAIDIEPLAAERSLLEVASEAERNETVAMLNIGATVTEISIFRRGILTFTRPIPLAGDALTQAIADALGISKDEAERYKIEMGSALPPSLAQPTLTPPPAPTEVPPAPPAAGLDFDLGGATPSAPPQEPVFDLSGETQPGAAPSTAPPSTPVFDLADTRAEEPSAPSVFDFDIGPTSPAPGESETAPSSFFDLSPEPQQPSAPASSSPFTFDFDALTTQPTTPPPPTFEEPAAPPPPTSEMTPPAPAPSAFGGEGIYGGYGDEITPHTVYNAMSPVLGEMVMEIRRSLEYYTGRYPDVAIDRVILLGGGAKLRQLDVFLTNELGIRTTVANPFDYVRGTLDEGRLRDLNPLMAVSVGLALRDMLE
ncbi:MAG: pilus assembly protein PilM [Abditibacteriales bacterium]|nr:pilus assembly protein PilM [Abditibacteriales bacterium]MDW8365440.1 type IV pilus assembly protein PilM [Abditibacteriales bacterium]